MARGQCYPWAAAYALKHLDDNVVVVHAIVTAPCSTPPHRYTHAWVEHNGMAYDWQTIEAGQGGPNFQGKGYPIDLFYELFTPERVHKYTPAEVLKLRGEHGHVGPWTEDHDDVIRQQMQREKGAAYARGSSSRAWAGSGSRV